MDKKENERKLNRFIENIGKKFSPCEIFLFGSRVGKEYWSNSDYDIITVSDKFKSVHWLDRISAIVKYWNLDVDIDVLPYTKEEFEWKKKESSFVRKVVSKSRVLSV